jgi:hypothetical protein
MKKITAFVGLFFLLIFSQTGKAQTAPLTTHALPGTYQYVFRLHGMEEEPVLTDNDLAAIEHLRHSDKEIFAKLNEITLIKILPQSVISAPGFSASEIPEKLYFVELNMETYSDIYKQAVNLK